jgi:biofilm protein TabA
MKKLSCLLFVFTLLFHLPTQAQSEKMWTKKQATEWYNSQEWLNGLQLKPHASTDPHEFARQYQSNKSGWDKAFTYLKETDFNSLTVGRHQIDGDNVFVIVTEAPAKTMENAKWESHRNYSDIHYVIKGKEQIGVTQVAKVKLTEAYDPAKDIMFYSGEGKFYVTNPGTFFIFPPKYAHRPSVKVEGDDSTVKKIVIKVKTDLPLAEK